ncbi:tetraspanin-18 [Helianthus annuus]|uniref:tetraspanin-18 n=1 Tax=Helianthus annuus TaxID=4232 RepID=UPI000B8FF878|nr:tetraspanin-18 [Helianthus annuus]
MRKSCCHSCLAFILKFLNIFQLFVGISIILYSVFMLHQWNKHLPDSSDAVSAAFNADRVISLGNMIGDSHSPWFIYAFMGIGVMLCCISCIGHIAAEAINGCCLYFYAVLKTLFILLEVALIMFIAFDRHWESDLPLDPTGAIDKFREFVESDVDFCKWIGSTVVVVQVVCLLFAVVLRAMVNLQMKLDEDDIEEDGVVRCNAWEPLLNPNVAQTSVSVNVNGKSFHSDIWSSRMREKYGLGSSNVK